MESITKVGACAQTETAGDDQYSAGPNSDSSVEVRCVAIDASQTPLRASEQGARMDTRFVFHTLMLRDKQYGESEDEDYTDGDVVKAFCEGKEEKLTGNNPHPAAEVLSQFDFAKPGRLSWLFDNGGPESDVSYLHTTRRAVFANMVQISDRRVKLTVLVLFHKLKSTGEVTLHYPEVLDIAINEKSVRAPRLRTELTYALLMDADAFNDGFTQSVVEALNDLEPTIYSFLPEGATLTKDRNARESRPVITGHAPSLKESNVEIRCVVKKVRITPHALFDDYRRDPEVEVHMLVLHNSHHTLLTKNPSWTSTEIVKIFYDGTEITRLAKNKACGLAAYIESELMNDGGHDEHLFEYGKQSHQVAYDHKVAEFVWEQTIPHDGALHTLRAKVLQHVAEADNGTQICYSEILSIELNGEITTEPNLKESVHDALICFDARYLAIATSLQSGGERDLAELGDIAAGRKKNPYL